MSAEQQQRYPSYAEQFDWFYTAEAQRSLADSLDQHTQLMYQIKGKEFAQKQHVLSALPWDFQKEYLECMVSKSNTGDYPSYHAKAKQLLGIAEQRKAIADQLLAGSQAFSLDLADFQIAVYNQLHKNKAGNALGIIALRELEHYLQDCFIAPMITLRHLEVASEEQVRPGELSGLLQCMPKEILAKEAVMGFDFYTQLQGQKEAVLDVFQGQGHFDDRQLTQSLKQTDFADYFEAEAAYQAAIARDKRILQVSALVIPIVAFFTVLPIMALFYYLPRYINRRKVFAEEWGGRKTEFVRAARVLGFQARAKKRAAFSAELDELCSQVVPVWRREASGPTVIEQTTEEQEQPSAGLRTPPPTPARSRTRSTTPDDIRAAVGFEPAGKSLLSVKSLRRERLHSANSFFANRCGQPESGVRRHLFGAGSIACGAN
jgi:hypothetical protein